jgi:hypothetical protein
MSNGIRRFGGKEEKRLLFAGYMLIIKSSDKTLILAFFEVHYEQRKKAEHDDALRFL